MRQGMEDPNALLYFSIIQTPLKIFLPQLYYIRVLQMVFQLIVYHMPQSLQTLPVHQGPLIGQTMNGEYLQTFELIGACPVSL